MPYCAPSWKRTSNVRYRPSKCLATVTIASVSCEQEGNPISAQFRQKQEELHRIGRQRYHTNWS